MTRWGIIGAGNIANRFCDSLAHIKDSQLYAISGRNQEKLDAFQEKHPCQKIYIGHENLLKDENVDAVYIALPHHMHAEWIIKAAQYHKDILVEKPAVTSYQDALAIQKAVEENHVVFMEGMKNLFVPAYRTFLEKLPCIGTLEQIELQHAFIFPKEYYGKHPYYFTKESGGVLWDIGCYGLGVIAPLLQGDPTFIKTQTNEYEGVEIYLHTEMEIDGVNVQLTNGIERSLDSKAVFKGKFGSITLSPMHRPTHLEITCNHQTESIDIPYDIDDFYSQIVYFESLRHGKENQIMPIEHTIKIAKWSDMIRSQFQSYTQEDLDLLVSHEEAFTIDKITSNLALQIGVQIQSLLPDYDRGVSIQVIRESDQAVIFQYIHDDKNAKNLQYAEGKHQCIYHYGHSSAWANIALRMHQIEFDMQKGLPSSGAFPLRNQNGDLLASILVSGLHEGKDYEIIIRALEIVFQKGVKSFYKAIG